MRRGGEQMPPAGKPVRAPRKKVNPLHAKRIKEVDWKDVTLLRQFISDRGKIRARRVTGLTPQQQRQVAVAIRNAREMALLPYPRAGRG
nr:30S ribosomal protein S18 [Pseudonocardia lacus]